MERVKIPTHVKIGSQVWTVSEQKRKHSVDQGHYGFTTEKDLSIVIDQECPESIKRVTLFHELLHAVRATFGGSHAPGKSTSYEEWEHYWIGIYEEPVVCMLRDNPSLVAYLLDHDA